MKSECSSNGIIVMQVGLLSAEVLLKHYGELRQIWLLANFLDHSLHRALQTSLTSGWSKEDLLQAWLEDAESVCDKAGVDMPKELGEGDFLAISEESRQDRLRVEGVQNAIDCGICCMVVDDHVQVPCDHHFCKDCWRE